MQCKVCSRHIDVCGPLSARGLCEDDSIGRVVANNTQMLTQSGEFYDRWAAGVIRYALPYVDRVAGGGDPAAGDRG